MIRPRPAGVRAVVLDLDEGAEPAQTAAAVRLLAERLGVVLVEVVPGALTVLVVAADRAALQRLLAALPRLPAAPEEAEASGAVLELPVRYDGPDLDHVARTTGLSVEQVVRRHSAVVYRAAFSGFAPGFAYLSGLDPVLRLPRRETPRTAVPAGALAVADGWTAVYPRRTPGGWHLLGTVDVPVFDLASEPPALLGPGRRVRFVPSA
jgi:KipI family sensor histidine kinase inhibitor